MLLTSDKIQKRNSEISEKELRKLLRALSEHQVSQDANIEKALKKIDNAMQSLREISKNDNSVQADLQQQVNALMDKITDTLGDLNTARLKDIQTFSKAIDHLTNNLNHESIVKSIEELKTTIVNREPMEWRLDIVRDQMTGAMIGVNAKQIK